MIKRLIRWLARVFGVTFEPPFEIVDNIDTFVKDKLNTMLKDAKSFDIATGYFQISGWKAFADSVENLLKKGGTVRLLIGDVSKEYLSPQTARLLLHLIKHPQVDARTIKPRLLHAKLFMAKNDKEARVLFGSSNITFGGMEANIELNTYETLDLKSKKASDLIAWYEELWESAVPIDIELKKEIEDVIVVPPKEVFIEDQNQALFLSLVTKDLARVDLRDIGNFAPLQFQYIDAVAGVNRFFFQPGGKRGLMLAHEVGLGKTIITGMILKHLFYHGRIKNTLIIAPLSIVRQWEEDLKNKFDMDTIEITSRRLKTFTVGNNIYIISYDLLREHIKNFHKNWDLIIVDESHFIRNKETQRFKAVKSLNSKFWLLLTATPMHNKVEDIATQLFLFVPEEIIEKATKREISKVDRTKLFKTFIKRRFQKKELSEIIPERNVLPPEVINLSEEEKVIYTKLLKFLSEDSKYYQIISKSIQYIAPFIKLRYLEEFTSSKEAIIFALENLKSRIENAIKTGYIEYNFGQLRKETEGQVADEIRALIEDQLEATAEITTERDDEGNLIIRFTIDDKIKADLQEDTKFLRDIIASIERIECFSKMKKVVDLIGKLKPSKDKKIVVFVGFIKTGEKLVEILKQKGIKSEFFHGALEEVQRKKLVNKLWKTDEERIDVLVSTDAAYVGLNLQIADTIIHHDLSWNPMVVEQRTGRIHRIGQKRPITSYSFLCKDTVDKRKHEILTTKLEDITTHLGMSYSVVVSEVAISSEIGRLMAQFELRKIDERSLKEGLLKHLTERREIFELLEDLPTEEVEIVQVGFSQKLIESLESIIQKLITLNQKHYEIEVTPIVENENFIIVSYKKDGRKVKELSTLNEKVLLTINTEEINEWREKYNFDNITPTYVGPFHPLITKVVDDTIKQNSGKFWKKKIHDRGNVVTLYLEVPVQISNPTAQIDTSLEIFVPILYDVESKEMEINAEKAYALVCLEGKIEKPTEDDEKKLRMAKEAAKKKTEDLIGKIITNIENVRVEMEELARHKHRIEIERKMEEKRRKLENLSREINRKRSAGLKYEEEMREAKRVKKDLDELQRKLEEVPESSLSINFGDVEIVGGCLYVS